MLHELPLVIFTIIAQASVGSFITLGLIHVLGAKVDPDVMDRVSDPALYVIGPLLVLGLGASTLHLGSPLRAINALRHVGTSWLSNEILAGLAFLVVGATFALMQWRKVGTARMRQVPAVLAAVIGVVLVYAISRVYSLRTVPAWDTVATPIRFFTTALLLGSLSVAAALVIAGRVRGRQGTEDAASTQLIRRVLIGISLGSIVLLGIKFVGLPMYLTSLANNPDPAAAESLRLLGTTYGPFSVLQYVTIFAGVAILGLFRTYLARGPVSQKVLLPVVLLAFTLVTVGEVVGRMLFYASMVRTGF